jgi:3-hydroxyisobutyrate dehydrogenase
MVGGDSAALASADPLLKCYSALIQHMGGPGFGQHAKMANQIMIAGQMVGAVEGLMYGHKAGLPLVQMVDVLSKGAAGSL